MATPAQVLTNQQNSQHSTGPRTAEGKRASSLNAVRHGLTSQLVVLPGEDHAPYEAFRTQLLAELAPQGTVENMLALTVCETQWRLERARKAEANILALAHYEALPELIDQIEDPATRSAMVEAHAAVKYEKALRNIQIQEARLQRSLYKALEELRATQSARRAAEKEQMSDAINARTYHQAREKKFDPADLGFVFTTADIDREIERRHMQRFPRSTSGPDKVRTRRDLANVPGLFE